MDRDLSRRNLLILSANLLAWGVYDEDIVSLCKSFPDHVSFHETPALWSSWILRTFFVIMPFYPLDITVEVSFYIVSGLLNMCFDISFFCCNHCQDKSSTTIGDFSHWPTSICVDSSPFTFYYEIPRRIVFFHVWPPYRTHSPEFLVYPNILFNILSCTS